MAIKGLINIEGLEVTGSYTNITNFNYNKSKDGDYSVTYRYTIYVSEEHRNTNKNPLQVGTGTVVFNDESDIIDPFHWMYGHLKANPYFSSGSLVDC